MQTYFSKSLLVSALVLVAAVAAQNASADPGDTLRWQSLIGIIQGNAARDEFRTAPLWGIGQRIYFLHDGRTYNLLEAIQAHKSDGSEANTVIDKFNKLTATQKQDILNFLRSL